MLTKDKPTPITLDEGERRVQTLIKNQLDEMERMPIWSDLSPDITNIIRHKIIRTAFGAYKVGLITSQRE